MHVGSVMPDGSAHVVPLWFVWLEEGVYVSCRRGSRVLANLRRDPRVVLELDLGRSWTEQTGLLLRGRAEVLPQDHPGTKRAISAWFEKYRAELSGSGFNSYAEEVVQPVLFRLRPDSLVGWNHRAPRTESP